MARSVHYRRATAMTLVEVLVALAIVSFVFSSLTQMTFDSLKRAKKLELQDKMRNYATEISQVVYTQKNSSWSNFIKLIPPATSTTNYSQVYLAYKTDNDTQQVQVELKPLSQALCHFDGAVLVGTGCESTIPPELENNKIFGRIAIRRDLEAGLDGNPANTENDANIDIVVACLENKCDPKEFPPFVLNLAIYRTGGSQ